MENPNALAGIANTKAADAAKSPMPPPPATPASSGKKRKRSEAAIARDKLVTSKRCQTFKLWEVLQRTRIIKDPKDADGLEKYISDMAILERDGYREYKKDMVEEDRERNAKLDEAGRKMDLQYDLYKEKMEKGMKMYVEYHHKCHEIDLKWLQE